ncbi:MAG: hypothetical protein GC184_14715 [Rhizobiales bacterium]|nr:hypothetical protein [Hyphomicrobiales bacterium]
MSPILLNVLSVAIAGSSLVISVLAFYRLLQLDRSGKFRALAETIDTVESARAETERKLGERLSHLEGALQHIPSAQQMNALRVELSKAEAIIAGLDGRLESLSDILRSHENRLTQIFDDALSRGRGAARGKT